MQNAAIKEPIVKTSAAIPPRFVKRLMALRSAIWPCPRRQSRDGDGCVLRIGSDHRRYTEKKDIREKMYAEKYEAKSKSYLQEVRGAAMIEYR
jgi:peptidyl-prolyl cis-trans isomerase SurA